MYFLDCFKGGFIPEWLKIVGIIILIVIAIIGIVVHLEDEE